VSASGLCLLHCLALPLIIAALPSLGGAVAGSGTHWVLLAFALPVSLWVLTRGVVFYEGHSAERILTVAGVSFVAAAHLVRWRRKRLTSSGSR